MKFVTPLSKSEQITLQCMRDYHSCRRVRMRAHGIILSHLGYAVQDIAFTFDVCRQTVSSWFDDWDSHGLAGLYDNPRSGRPMALNEQEVKLNKPKSTEKKELVIPEYFNQAIRKNKKAFATFTAFSYTNKKEYLDWITEAKTESTRDNRLKQAIEWMTEGKIRNWKYAK